MKWYATPLLAGFLLSASSASYAAPPLEEEAKVSDKTLFDRRELLDLEQRLERRISALNQDDITTDAGALDTFRLGYVLFVRGVEENYETALHNALLIFSRVNDYSAGAKSGSLKKKLSCSAHLASAAAQYRLANRENPETITAATAQFLSQKLGCNLESDFDLFYKPRVLFSEQ